MYRFIRLAVASIALATPLTAQARLSVTGLLTEYRANPLGTDIAKPRLSWRIENAQRNTMHAAYQIQVASSAAAVKGAVASARVYVTARGLYELHLNGQRIGDDFFTPGWTSLNKRLQYQTYDVTSALTQGIAPDSMRAAGCRWNCAAHQMLHWSHP